MKDILTFDASTARRIDENGYLHVSGNRITKAVVNPYYGHEIPGWEEAGLDPEKVDYGFRAPEELKKAVGTFSGVPLQLDHHPDSADDPQKQARVGTIGTDAARMDPYVVASLCVWDADAIDAIESGRMKELSCAYRYDPDFTQGTYDGQRYDFVMRNIRGNHVALVEEGRAGPDVVVADKQTVKECSMDENMMQDGDPAIEQKEVDLAQAIIDLHRVDPMTGQLVDGAEDEDKNAEIRRLMDELTATMTPEQAQTLPSALSDLAYSKPTGDAEGSNAEFAEGVKYGEKLIRNPEEREKLDREHEREGMEKKYGMDAATVRREAAVEARKQMKELSDAARKVRPLCGEIDPFAFDSAQDIYRHAIESRGRDASRYQPAAWEGIVDVMLESPMAADSAPVSTKETMLPHLDRFIR